MTHKHALVRAVLPFADLLSRLPARCMHNKVRIRKKKTRVPSDKLTLASGVVFLGAHREKELGGPLGAQPRRDDDVPEVIRVKEL